ncbi:MAG: hypothetical protein NT080_11150 [Spirochaetes bacterium]|nr:hypothetical protein [Spirochaetota bacterium]
MFTPVYVVAAIAFLFYLGIPVMGAFRVRSHWRSVRIALEYLCTRPTLSFAEVSAAERRRASACAEREAVGIHALYGSVEAVEGVDRLWVRDGILSALVEMGKASVFLLRGGGLPGADLLAGLESADERFVETPWREFSAIDSGMRVFVGGPVFAERGVATFLAGKTERPIVVFYDGEDADLLLRAIWAGRHRNEYWNPATFTSLAVGISATVVALSSVLLRPSFSFTIILTTCLALLPIMPLIPPGTAFFLLYRRFWHQGRVWRARRDVVKVAIRRFRHHMGSRRKTEPKGSPGNITAWSEKKPDSARFLDPMLAGLEGWSVFVPEDPESGLAPLYVRGKEPLSLASACGKAAWEKAALAGVAFVSAVLSSSAMIFFGFRFLVR